MTTEERQAISKFKEWCDSGLITSEKCEELIERLKTRKSDESR